MIEFIGGILDGEFRFIEGRINSYIHIWYVEGEKRHCFYHRDGENFKVWRKHVTK